jgi:hypothetical protein
MSHVLPLIIDGDSYRGRENPATPAGMSSGGVGITCAGVCVWSARGGVVSRADAGGQF